MAGPAFGFSVGDFITGIQLAKDVVQALSDTGGARLCFRSLAAELKTLRSALREISCIGDEVSGNVVGRKELQDAVLQCQTLIERFLAKHEKFQRSLGEEARGTSRLRASWHKIEWAVGRKSEVDELRAKILGHTTTINTLLISMQSSVSLAGLSCHLRLGICLAITWLTLVNRSNAFLQTALLRDCRRDNETQLSTLYETQDQVKQANTMIRTQADTLSKILNIIGNASSSSSSSSCFSVNPDHQYDDSVPPPQGVIHSVMLQTLEANLKICGLMTEMQREARQQQLLQQKQEEEKRKQQLEETLPPQIQNQQPVQFEDAHGRIAPFHVEFVNSLDAFLAVMEVRFRDVPGLSKVQRWEYVIREPETKRTLDLHAPWKSVFLPGRRVTMSMVFWRPLVSANGCPSCYYDNKQLGLDDEIQCSNPQCRIWYDRVVEPTSPTKLVFPDSQKQQQQQQQQQQPPAYSYYYRGADSKESEEEEQDNINQFKRVQVRHLLTMSESL